MSKAKLEEHIKNIIHDKYTRELWSSRPEYDYEEGLQSFVDDLVDAAVSFKKGLKLKTFPCCNEEGDECYTPGNTDEIMGKNLKELRLAKGLSLAQLARKAGMNVNYYTNIERGEILLHLWGLERALDVLGAKSSAVLPF